MRETGAMRNDAFEIQTDRTIIRLATQHDIQALVAYYQNNEQHLSRLSDINTDYYDPLFWENEILRRKQDNADDKSCKMCAFSKSNQEVVGIANYFGFIRGAFHACILGYSLAEKHMGMGMMQEILIAANKYVFNTLKLHRIMANYEPSNIKSRRTLEALGFIKEGYAKDYLYFHGKWHDHVLTSLTNHDWG